MAPKVWQEDVHPRDDTAPGADAEAGSGIPSRGVGRRRTSMRDVRAAWARRAPGHPVRWSEGGEADRGEGSEADDVTRPARGKMRHSRSRAAWMQRHGHGPGFSFVPSARVHHPAGVFIRLVVGIGVFLALAAGAVALSVRVVGMILDAGAVTRHPVFLIGLGTALFLGVGAAALYAGRRVYSMVAVPMAQLMSAAEAVTAGDLSARVPEEGAGRLRQVMGTFNEMVASLERADQQRRNLTADVAHELRTPLQVIQGNLEGVLDGIYTPDEVHIEATLEATYQLGRLVGDLRTLSLAESGQLPLSMELVDVAELLRDTQTSFGGRAEAAGVALDVEVDGDGASLVVAGDPGRLDQVLGNLLVNAIRHTPSGGRVVLSATAREDGTVLCVRDTGEGIAPEDLPYIFDRFWRADRARTHQPGTGSGLGLAITRQLVRLHGGSIDVESALGMGTTFTILLPAGDV